MSGLPEGLVLDVEIRNYVLISILVSIFFLGLIRTHLFSSLFGANPPTLEKIYDDQIIQRVRRLQQNGNRLTRSAYLSRREFFNNSTNGLLTKKSTKPKAPEGMPELGNNPLMDPSNMGGMMKGQVAMVLNNIYMIMIYNGIEHLFSGFIAAKLPFSLTRGFKMMFQAGIDLNDLEVSYISSSSWYLLNFTGMAGVNEILLGPKADINMSQMQMPMMASQQPAADPYKVFSTHQQTLAIRDHKWDGQDSLKRLTGKYIKPPQQTTKPTARGNTNTTPSNPKRPLKEKVV